MGESRVPRILSHTLNADTCMKICHNIRSLYSPDHVRAEPVRLMCFQREHSHNTEEDRLYQSRSVNSTSGASVVLIAPSELWAPISYGYAFSYLVVIFVTIHWRTSVGRHKTPILKSNVKFTLRWIYCDVCSTWKVRERPGLCCGHGSCSLFKRQIVRDLHRSIQIAGSPRLWWTALWSPSMPVI